MNDRLLSGTLAVLLVAKALQLRFEGITA